MEVHPEGNNSQKGQRDPGSAPATSYLFYGLRGLGVGLVYLWLETVCEGQHIGHCEPWQQEGLLLGSLLNHGRARKAAVLSAPHPGM